MKISLPLPPTTNHIYGRSGNRTYMKKKAKDWKTECSWTIKQTWRPKPTLKGDVKVKVTYYLKRDRDLDGGNKLLFDTMEGIVYENDKQIVQINLYKEWDKENPRIEVEVL